VEKMHRYLSNQMVKDPSIVKIVIENIDKIIEDIIVINNQSSFLL